VDGSRQTRKTQSPNPAYPPGSSADFGGPTTVVEQFNIRDATLDIMRTDGNRYSFPIRQLIIRNLRKGQAISYFLDMQNPKPTGRIQSTGRFGPLLPNNLGATPVSGDFTFSPVETMGGDGAYRL
jgi:hypothetical protein